MLYDWWRKYKLKEVLVRISDSFNIFIIFQDINDDVFGGMNVGMKGILVKTGKYITGIETKYSQKPTNICNSFADAVNWLIEENFVI